jgi:hypothetical protein
MVILQLNSLPIEQQPDLRAFAETLGQWCSGREYPVRFLALSHPFRMAPATKHVRRDMEQLQGLHRLAAPLLRALEQGGQPTAVLAGMAPAEQAVLRQLFQGTPALETALAAGDDLTAWQPVGEALTSLLWPLPWQKEMLRFYDALSQRHIRSATYLMLVWEPKGTTAESLRSTLALATGRPVTILDALPSVLPGPYTEHATKLAPAQPGLPWLTILSSYDLRGTWNPTTLHTLMDVPFDLAISIDIGTMNRASAQRAADLSHNLARTLIRQGTKDTRAERIYHDSEYIMHALQQQSLHHVNVSVLVAGDTEDDLTNHVAEVTARLGTALKLHRVGGVQSELLKLFSATRTTDIQAPLKTRNVLSTGVGCLLGLVGYHRASETDGMLWGLDGMRRAPIFFNLFKGNQAGHTAILGKTGYGKTWFINQVTMRGAAIQGYKIIGIDAFKNGERIESAAGAGARCNWIGMETPINIFDIVADPNEPEWITTQVATVLNQLGMLLGDVGRNAEGKEILIERRFSTGERGVLDRAITTLYRATDPHAPLDQMPILSDLIALLEGYREQESHAMARDLRMFCFGTDDPHVTTRSTYGFSFNQHSQVDWSFRKDINYYDFSAVPVLLRPFYYAQAIGAILRYMRDPLRDRSRRTLLIIDEFGYVTQVQAVAAMAAGIAKVARKYGIALMVIDQNPHTFLENPSGRAIWENTRMKIMFHLDDAPARAVGEVLGDLAPQHVAWLPKAGKGECLLLIDNDVFVAIVETNPRETRAFQGS